MTNNFINAQQMHKEHPDTFEVPDKDELSSLKQHDTVKISTGDERFWVEILMIEDKNITGLIVNDLINTDIHGLVIFDTVEFTRDNIYSIYG